MGETLPLKTEIKDSKNAAFGLAIPIAMVFARLPNRGLSRAVVMARVSSGPILFYQADLHRACYVPIPSTVYGPMTVSKTRP